jgi:hypothetical protein
LVSRRRRWFRLGDPGYDLGVSFFVGANAGGPVGLTEADNLF